MQTERRVAANPQTKPTDLGRESAPKDWLLPSADTIAIYYYYSARKLIHMYSFYRPTEGGRLSRRVYSLVLTAVTWSE